MSRGGRRPTYMGTSRPIMRRPHRPSPPLLAAALSAVALLPASAGAQSYDDPLLSGYGGPGAGEQSLFGGQLLPGPRGGGGGGAQGAPRTPAGALDLSGATAAAAARTSAGGQAAGAGSASGTGGASARGGSDGSAARGSGARGKSTAAGATASGGTARPPGPLPVAPVAALDRPASAGSPVSPGAIFAFAGLLLLLAVLAHVLRGTEPARRA